MWKASSMSVVAIKITNKIIDFCITVIILYFRVFLNLKPLNLLKNNIFLDTIKIQENVFSCI